MYLAKLSANGQITVPAEVPRRLHLVPGDKVLFVEKWPGSVLWRRPRPRSQVPRATSESLTDDVQAVVDDLRGRVS